jgi:hypothetical protein
VTDAAIAYFDCMGLFADFAETLWEHIARAALGASEFGHALTEPDRDRLIEEICKRLTEAMRAPADED